MNLRDIFFYFSFISSLPLPNFLCKSQYFGSQDESFGSCTLFFVSTCQILKKKMASQYLHHLPSALLVKSNAEYSTWFVFSQNNTSLIWSIPPHPWQRHEPQFHVFTPISKASTFCHRLLCYYPISFYFQDCTKFLSMSDVVGLPVLS